MKKCSFRYKFNKTIYILSLISLILSLSGALFSLFKLLNVFSMHSFSVAVDILSIIISLGIALLIAMLLLFSKYNIDESGITLIMFIFKQRIPAQALQYIVENKETKLICVYFLTNPEDKQYNFLPININCDNNASFIKKLKEIHPPVVYELFSKENNNEN